LILEGGIAVKQAPVFKGLLFDTLTLFENPLLPAEGDNRRGQVLQARVISMVIIVLDAVVGLGFEIPG
jgi:hypothetical protein